MVLLQNLPRCLRAQPAKPIPNATNTFFQRSEVIPLHFAVGHVDGVLVPQWIQSSDWKKWLRESSAKSNYRFHVRPMACEAARSQRDQNGRGLGGLVPLQ